MIWINEPTKVFVARRGVHELTTTILTADEVRDLVERMLKSSGRRVDLSTPFVEANSRLGWVRGRRSLLRGRVPGRTAFDAALGRTGAFVLLGGGEPVCGIRASF